MGSPSAWDNMTFTKIHCGLLETVFTGLAVIRCVFGDARIKKQ
jgi:hypothetical protein